MAHGAGLLEKATFESELAQVREWATQGPGSEWVKRRLCAGQPQGEAGWPPQGGWQETARRQLRGRNSWPWWRRPVFPAPWETEAGNPKFKISLGNQVRPCLQIK